MTSGDYADMTRDLVALVSPGRRLVFLEGGYDLEALSLCSGSVLSVLVDGGSYRPEPASAGGPGLAVSNAVLKNWSVSADG